MKRPLFIICLILVAFYSVLFLTGAFAGDAHTDLSELNGKTITVTGVIYNTEGSTCYIRHTNIFSKPTCGLYFDISDKTISDIEVGKTITVCGVFRMLTAPTNPGEFDSRDYYSSQNIFGHLSSIKIVSISGNRNSIKHFLNRLKSYWKGNLYAIYPQKEASILSNLLLGEKSEIDKDIKQLYQKNGIAHILSISSLHISIIGMGLFTLLKVLGLPTYICAVASDLVLLFYGFLTGMSTSALRAIGMFTVLIMSYIFKRTCDKCTSLGFVAVLMLMVRPSSISSCSFLLSFGSAAGIVLVYPPIYKLISNQIKNIHLIPKSLITSLLFSLSINLSITPIQLYFFYEIPTNGILLNIIVLPLMTLLMVTSLISMLIPIFSPIGAVSYWILKFYELICIKSMQLPFHSWNPGKPALWQIILYYICLTIILCLIRLKDSINTSLTLAKSYHFKKIPSKFSHKSASILFSITITILSIILVYIISMPRLHNSSTLFLDVGQGDCVIMRTNNGKTILYDCGSSSKQKVGEYILKPALKSLGLSDIEAIIISHPDADHCNGIMELIKNSTKWDINIRNLILFDGEISLNNELIDDIIDTAISIGIPISYISSGQEFLYGSSTFTCLSPDKDKIYADTNAASVCLLVRLYDEPSAFSLLLTGDIYGDAEAELAQKVSSAITRPLVLKVAHHGSKYSTDNCFIELCKPTVSIISVGKNKYGHPHPDTMDRLSQSGSLIYRTDECGAITIAFKKERIKVDTFCPR